MAEPSIHDVLDALARTYGEPEPPPERSVFELLVLENVAYLVDDAARAQAFRELRRRIGLTPEAILRASEEALQSVAAAGILASNQVGKLRRIASLASESDPASVKALPLREAKRQLMRYPSIGEPGAEKILLLARSHAVLGLDSNGVRVLARLGRVEEHKSYSATYKAVQTWAESLRDVVGGGVGSRGVGGGRVGGGRVGGEGQGSTPGERIEWLIRAHQLLRTHGQQLCKRSVPKCELCPLSDGCRYYARAVSRPGLAKVGLADQLGPQ